MRAHNAIFTIIFVGLLSLWPACSASAQDAPPPQPTYNWEKGPMAAPLGDQAVLRLPEGYAFLGPQETQRMLKDMGNFPSGSELGLVASASDQEEWFVVIRFIDAGYVKDDDAADWDAEAMLASIKEGTEETNQKRQQMGISPLTIRGWEEKPHYDKASNKVVWAISADSAQGSSVNYNTLALGRDGYMSMNLVADLGHLPQLKPHASTLLANLEFVQGKRYTDFNSATDKVAAVGLAALVAGAAFKSGLLAKLFVLLVAFKKVIFVVALAIGGWLVKFFTGRRASAHSA